MWEEPSPHQRGPQPSALGRAGPSLAGQAAQEQDQVLKTLPLGMEEVGVYRNISEEALCIMGRKTDTEMIQRMTKRRRVVGTLSLSIRQERCVCRERQGYDGPHVLALDTWWLVLTFF